MVVRNDDVLKIFGQSPIPLLLRWIHAAFSVSSISGMAYLQHFPDGLSCMSFFFQQVAFGRVMERPDIVIFLAPDIFLIPSLRLMPSDAGNSTLRLWGPVSVHSYTWSRAWKEKCVCFLVSILSGRSVASASSSWYIGVIVKWQRMQANAS